MKMGLRTWLQQLNRRVLKEYSYARNQLWKGVGLSKVEPKKKWVKKVQSNRQSNVPQKKLYTYTISEEQNVKPP